MKCPKCHSVNSDSQRFCHTCGAQLFQSDSADTSTTETLEIPLAELTRGDIFAGRYEIIEELGSGGTGRVYRVFDKKIGEEIALKLLKPEITANKGAYERFSNEIKYARKIGHRNVCRLYDLNEEKGIHYITMEYIKGGDLKTFIKRSRQLTVNKAVAIAQQVCEGLAEAHRSGTVHRDLKSQNIMIDKEGNARIMDFGIALSLEVKGITEKGALIGTPEYMSPEQFEGKKVERRSDIYSLGIILYEMVTGRLPFEGKTPISLALKHKREMPEDPKKFNAKIPDDLRIIILKCLMKEKDNRYDSAEDLLSDLSKIGAGKPHVNVARPPDWKNSIAVLPFADLSPKKDQEYFCDGLAEELINALTKIKDLKVVARMSAFSFKGRDVDIRDIGRKLNVETVLEGSVRKSGDRLRITAQLINVSDGFHLWSERFDTEVKDVFAVQDEISKSIVSALKIKLVGRQKSLFLKRYTEDHEAYNLYLKGRFYWNKRTEEWLRKGIEYFDQAIMKDPKYALAYAGLADSYNILGYYSIVSPKKAFPKALESARRALELDEMLAEAHSSLAFVKLYYDWDWIAAEREFEHALELNSGYSTAHHWYAEYLALMGRLDEAFEETEKALELDPLSLIINTLLGWVFYYSRNYDQAIERLEKTIGFDPNFVPAFFWLGLAYGKKSLFNEAISTFQKAIPLSENSAIMLAALGIVKANSGNTSGAKRQIKELKMVSKKKYVSSYYTAAIYAALGERDQAFEWLEKAYKEHDMWMTYLNVDPIWDSLHSDSKFKILLKRMNLEL